MQHNSFGFYSKAGSGLLDVERPQRPRGGETRSTTPSSIAPQTPRPLSTTSKKADLQSALEQVEAQSPHQISTRTETNPMGGFRGWCGGDLEEEESCPRPVVVHKKPIPPTSEIRGNIRNELVSGEMTPADAVVSPSNGDVPNISRGTPWFSLSQLWRNIRRRRAMIPSEIELLATNNQQPDQLHDISAFRPLTKNTTEDQLPQSELPMLSSVSLFDTHHPKQAATRPEPNVISIKGSVCQQRGTIMLAEKKTDDDKQPRDSSREEPSAHDSRALETHLSSGEVKARALAPATVASGEGASKIYQPTIPRDLDAEPWTTAALIKLPDGSHKAVKLFYDTGSTDNMITESLVDEHKFTKRPILPEDLMVYKGVGNSDFVPTHYAELELTDEENGIVEFTKVSFNIAGEIGNHSLLAGRTFMNKHGFRISSIRSRKKNPESLVLIPKPAGKDAKEKQAALVERNKKDQQRADEIKSSTSTSSRGATSQGQPMASSSRTSVPSSGHRKKT